MSGFRRQRIPPKNLPPIVVTKWSAEHSPEGLILTEGWVPLPKRLLRCMHHLFRGPDAIEQLAVVLAVVDYKRPNLTRPPSLDYLAFLAGLEAERFSEVLDQLVDKGLAEREGDDEELNVEIDGLLQEIQAATAGPTG